MADNGGSIIPGDSPDPGNDVERSIKAAWALGGMAIPAGVVTFALKGTGFVFLPATPQLVDYARAFAFSIACTNILFWIWFPLEDLRVLRMWIRVKKMAFAAHTSEFLLMMSVAILLIFLIISSTINVFIFGVVGTAIYIMNLVGFATIRRQVAKAVSEAQGNYSNAPSPNRKLLLNALDVSEKYWSVSARDGPLRNRQQIRHVLLSVAFLAVALLGIIARAKNSPAIEAVAYALGALIIIVAEVSIAVWRTSRDRSLHRIFEELRFIHNRSSEEPSSRTM